MRVFGIRGLTILLGLSLGLVGWTEEYHLSNGNTLVGELASADEDGLVVRLDVGGYSKREPWINFSQETLRKLLQNPDAREHVEPFIEPTPEELAARAKRKEIRVREVPTRLERPTGKTGLVAGFLTPIGMMFLGVLVLANLFAGFEVAVFKNQPVILVCGISFLFPVVGQIAFMLMPSRVAVSSEGAEPGVEVLGAVGRKTTTVVAEKPASGLSLASAAKAGPAAALAQPQVYQRGDHTFNRRFFETKFPGFFRVVPSEAEKDLVLVIKGIKNEYVGRRISRISSNELHLQLQTGTAEVNVPFVEITTVTLRHKDARP